MIVCIDPGHGGADPGGGTVAGVVREADLVLDYGKALAAELRERGHRVILTREGDSTVSLQERAACAHRHRADVFVSLHTNAPGTHARGMQTLYCATSERSRRLAAVVQSVVTAHDFGRGPWAGIFPDASRHVGFTKAARRFYDGLSPALSWRERDRQTRDRFGGKTYRTLYVLRATKMPAVLIELGFLTNPKERAEILSTEKRATFARATADALEAWTAPKTKPVDPGTPPLDWAA